MHDDAVVVSDLPLLKGMHKYFCSWSFLISLTSQLDFYQNNDLIKNIGAHCKITRGPEIFTWAQGVLQFPVHRKLHFNPCSRFVTERNLMDLILVCLIF